MQQRIGPDCGLLLLVLAVILLLLTSQHHDGAERKVSMIPMREDESIATRRYDLELSAQGFMLRILRMASIARLVMSLALQAMIRTSECLRFKMDSPGKFQKMCTDPVKQQGDFTFHMIWTYVT